LDFRKLYNSYYWSDLEEKKDVESITPCREEGHAGRGMQPAAFSSFCQAGYLFVADARLAILLVCKGIADIQPQHTWSQPEPAYYLFPA
jgi:hypothetical protein